MSKSMEVLNNSGQQIQVPLKCEICDEEYKSKQGLISHVNRVHKFSLIKEYQCNICQSRFDSQRQLTLHTKISHENKKHHKCNSCGKSFSYDHQLKKHND